MLNSIYNLNKEDLVKNKRGEEVPSYAEVEDLFNGTCKCGCFIVHRGIVGKGMGDLEGGATKTITINSEKRRRVTCPRCKQKYLFEYSKTITVKEVT